jgi:hypothetical protein
VRSIIGVAFLAAPERNPKLETRNPKRIPMTENGNSKRQPAVWDIWIWSFRFVSGFGFRASYLVVGSTPRYAKA